MAFGVVVAGSYAYVAASNSGLQLIDISNPLSSVIVGSVDTPWDARGVAVSGNYAYVASSEAGLQIVDITDPFSPAISGSLETAFAKNVTVLPVEEEIEKHFNSLSDLKMLNSTKPNISVQW